MTHYTLMKEQEVVAVIRTDLRERSNTQMCAVSVPTTR